ncbi:hypothetical protein [Ottowia thiooxydans]|uniref:hypothetical protein n=1 Tax=Ottowia thiooxydans TaxID=219182 RepID=UPI0004205815|nr:hypothetical protein [Ottowia thiooxydans]
MSISEIALWSALAGGLLTLFALTVSLFLSDRRSPGTLKNVLFVTATGSSVIIVCGLPEVLFPQVSTLAWLIAKVSVGPLSAALTLSYLNLWMGGSREDRPVHRLLLWGSRALLLAGLALAVSAALAPPHQFEQVLLAAALVNLFAVLLGIGVTTRAAVLGDPLAGWMTVACVLLFFMTSGLYLRALEVPLGLGVWALTAVLTLAYFLLTSVLVSLRNHENRRLAQLARLDPTVEPSTGLPSGASLVSKVEHTLWATGRKQNRSTVICIYLSNLYELADTVERGADSQILPVMAARIRRIVGFRCVVGIYHPRCFVIVQDAERLKERSNSTLPRLRTLLPQSMQVLGPDAKTHTFKPQIGIGIVETAAGRKALDVLHEAERQAQYSSPVESEDNIETIQ